MKKSKSVKMEQMAATAVTKILTEARESPGSLDAVAHIDTDRPLSTVESLTLAIDCVRKEIERRKLDQRGVDIGGHHAPPNVRRSARHRQRLIEALGPLTKLKADAEAKEITDEPERSSQENEAKTKPNGGDPDRPMEQHEDHPPQG